MSDANFNLSKINKETFHLYYTPLTDVAGATVTGDGFVTIVGNVNDIVFRAVEDSQHPQGIYGEVYYKNELIWKFNHKSQDYLNYINSNGSNDDNIYIIIDNMKNNWYV